MNKLNPNRPLYHSFISASKNLSGTNARERAYLKIRDKIIYMELKPGEPLSDKVLAEQLEMSRTPVREALILLSAYHMVVLKPQSGTFVTPIDPTWVAMEQFSRMTMEKEIIRTACTLKPEGLAQAYADNAEQFREYHDGNAANRIRRMHQLDNDFHSLAFSAIGRMDNFLHMHSYMQHIERLRVLALMMDVDKALNADHQSIAQAIVAGDERTAVQRLEDHLCLYQNTLKIAKAQYPEYFELG